ncbi:tRNA (cytidine(56)-2'-O)-methyltransferase [uncultured archaeon]|nr:tRNA (cytidine(56)-2'-O)-methyltransferase [uncultured archaeon]
MLTILRLSHRRVRDARLTTHVCLTARALGADEVILSGERDENVLESVSDVAKRWGGKFKIRYEEKSRKIIEKFKGIKIHLTMYGMPVQDKISEIKEKSKGKDVLIIVGGEKVPGEVYQLADYNIAVTGQPHSEVAALAVFLHEFFEGKELTKKFGGAKLTVISQERGKKVI